MTRPSAKFVNGLRRFLSLSMIAGTAAMMATSAQAGEGLPHTIDFYAMLADAIGVSHAWVPTIGALVLTVLFLIAGLKYRASVAAAGQNVVPDGRFSLRFVVDSILDVAYGLTKENCGHNFKSYMPLMGGIFMFILISNLSGLIPGFPTPTGVMETNVAIGLVVFLVYNVAGVKEHGPGYLKHFLGPVWWIAPLFVVIELVSHSARPLSLGLRLTGNLFADHTLLSVFTSMTYVGFPVFLMFFGLIVAVVQSFVFTLLTGIYISLAISHDH